MNDHHSEDPPSAKKLFSIMGIVGSMLLFFIILAITYIPKDREPVEGNIVAMREATLEENTATDQEKLNEVKVIDPNARIFKIPVSDAMDLTAAKLQTPPQ